MSEKTEAETPSEDEAANAQEGPENGTDPTAAPTEVEEAAQGDDTPAAETGADDTAALAAEVSNLKDQLLRTLAEMENLRRRAQREREDLQRYASASLARDLLGVADNLRRALDSVGNDTSGGEDRLKTLIEGVTLTEKELLTAFEKNSIVKLDPVGEKLDPHKHEAMFEMPAPDHENGTVVQVVQSGYLLHDRLLRPARVGVAKNPAQAAKPEQQDAKPGDTVDTSA